MVIQWGGANGVVVARMVQWLDHDLRLCCSTRVSSVGPVLCGRARWAVAIGATRDEWSRARGLRHAPL